MACTLTSSPDYLQMYMDEEQSLSMHIALLSSYYEDLSIS